MLPNGKVLVAGGVDTDYISIARAELYNPASGTWTETGSLVTARSAHRATLLPNGEVLVMGGSESLGVYPPNAELYDPVSGTWAETGSLVTLRALQTATSL